MPPSYKISIIDTVVVFFSGICCRLLFMLTLAGLILCSCEKNIDIKLNNGEEKIVVEGHIEPGLPPYVALTYSKPYFSSLNAKDLSTLFVHHAIVKVSDGKDTVTLKEISSDTIPPFLLDIISTQLGFQLSGKDTSGIVVYAYLSTDTKLLGQEEKTYFLDVQVGSSHLSASTFVPKRGKLDSLWCTPHPADDTLATLNVRYSDPAAEMNYIRYFTSVNNHPFYPPLFQSVLDDRSLFNVDGKTFNFPIEKGHSRTETIDFNTFTYFTVGDSVLLKWCAIDKAHYTFWSTAEFDRNSSGNPFSSPTTIKTNINGGLGIWGGYSPSYYFVEIKK